MKMDDEEYEVLKKKIIEACEEPYHVGLAGNDVETAIEAWNQGIDSRFEAITERSEWDVETTCQGRLSKTPSDISSKGTPCVHTQALRDGE